jgi:hypothetical protein
MFLSLPIEAKMQEFHVKTKFLLMPLHCSDLELGIIPNQNHKEQNVSVTVIKNMDGYTKYKKANKVPELD